MDDAIVVEANRLKRLAGQKLDKLLNLKFTELKEQGILKSFCGKKNFCHTGFTYKFQYKTNFILETLDDKLIIINSSNSYRDRVKQDLYDFEGIMKHAIISDKIIASILLFPDEEFEENGALVSFRRGVENKTRYCPATHIMGFSDLIQFLENHKFEVEQELELEKEEAEKIKDGSFYGKRGNAFELDVVSLLKCYEQLNLFKIDPKVAESLYAKVIGRLLEDSNCNTNELISVEATNTVKKLASGGNAKTDIIVRLNTTRGVKLKTISVKNTTQSSVSCHDYKADDFIRVLGIKNQKLIDYLTLFQKCGSHQKFIDDLPNDYNVDDFEKLIKPHAKVLLEWALTGEHDLEKLIDGETQVSKYLLINKDEKIRFVRFDSYMGEITKKCKSTYGVPLKWTYPSKQRGARIQLKLPIIVM